MQRWRGVLVVLVVALVPVAVAVHRDPGEAEAMPTVPVVDVRPLITVVDEPSADAQRTRLLDEVWSGALPVTLPDREMVVHMPYGFDSHLQLIEPEGEPTCAAVVWHGHSYDTPGVNDLAVGAAEAGCVVVLGWMPMFGPNPKPVVDTLIGEVRFTRHDQFDLIEDDTSTLALFLEPVAAAVNLLDQRWPDLPISMTGLSGGGWTTTVYAALDERVRLSIPVAGSLPDFLRSFDANGEDRGDYEQQHSALPDYLDLYVLATTAGRTQVQVLIDGDPCCFNAAGGRHELYEATVDDLAEGFGGSFQVAVFAQDEHAIGAGMRGWILGSVA